MNSIVVHYQEIALKGRNRPWFIGRLVDNLRTATSDLDVAAVRALMGRIEVVLGPSADPAEAGERIGRTFGVANYAMAGRTRPDLDALSDAILEKLTSRPSAAFRVSARRSDKSFPMTSPEIERELGRRIQAALGWPVNLSSPELVVNVELLRNEAFYSFGKQPGPGGLPTGSSGRVACLMSGGIDSPVAAFRMMNRGCQVLLVHFHSYPFVTAASQEKVRDIAELLTRYQLRTKLHLVAFGEIQRRIVLSVPPPLRVVVYRRFMVRIAEALARKWSAMALVTGEVIGQVASQTLENLSVVASVAGMPILRPLVGMDKGEITRQAQAIGTYPISIVPDQDCCQLFTPRNPATRARPEEVENAERDLPVDEWVAQAAAAAETEEFVFPGVKQAKSAPAARG